MGRMAELSWEVESMINRGYSSNMIAETLLIPLAWIQGVEDNMNVYDFNVTEEEQYYDERT